MVVSTVRFRSRSDRGSCPESVIPRTVDTFAPRRATLCQRPWRVPPPLTPGVREDSSIPLHEAHLDDTGRITPKHSEGDRSDNLHAASQPATSASLRSTTGQRPAVAGAIAVASIAYDVVLDGFDQLDM
jgi:hypothetical protein